MLDILERTNLGLDSSQIRSFSKTNLSFDWRQFCSQTSSRSSFLWSFMWFCRWCVKIVSAVRSPKHDQRVFVFVDVVKNGDEVTKKSRMKTWQEPVKKRRPEWRFCVRFEGRSAMRGISRRYSRDHEVDCIFVTRIVVVVSMKIVKCIQKCKSSRSWS